MTRPHLARILATAAACLVAVAANACGSAGASKQDVIARGNAICASTVRAVRALVPPATGSAGEALAGYFTRLQRIVADEVAQLGRLPRPEADRAVLERYIDAVTMAGGVYRQLTADAQRNDLTGVAADLGALQTNPAQSLARRYGMSQCAASAGTAIR